jgi:hypothetical protein
MEKGSGFLLLEANLRALAFGLCLLVMAQICSVIMLNIVRRSMPMEVLLDGLWL